MVKAQRRPLAFGMWHWPDLPGTGGEIQWDGPGERLWFYRATEHNPQGTRMPIHHPAANGTYDTIKQADAAVQAFVAAVEAEEAEDD